MNHIKSFNRKPKIAIVARSMYCENIEWLVNAKSIFDAILSAGGIPAMLYLEEEDDCEDIANMFEGLLLPGGNDINPSFYHRTQYAKCIVEGDYIDTLDDRIIQSFARRKKPILGICRGMQSINVAFGGTLYQDIEVDFHKQVKIRHDQRIENGTLNYKNTYAHKITCHPNTKLFTWYTQQADVNSFHHQCIDKLAPGFVISAYATDDKIIEGIEKDNIIGVQWHPEWLLEDENNRTLFQNFVKEASSCIGQYQCNEKHR